MKTVLVVEDDSSLARLAQLNLTAEGYDVIVCREGDGALATLAKATPDLVLLDLNLPGRNGIEVLQLLKSEPRLRQIPVVLLSTSNLESDVKRALACGADSYLSKPGRFDVLQRQLQQLVTRLRTGDSELADSAWA